jgi:hypothetical protein
MKDRQYNGQKNRDKMENSEVQNITRKPNTIFYPFKENN